MVIRKITPDETESFYEMMCRLDEETEFMMYEPGEREENTKDLSFLKANIESAFNGEDLLLGAYSDDGEIVGFIWAQRGNLRRIRHTAYIVTGIRQAYRRQGIGTEFFLRLDEWAKENGVIRLELTVECANTAARNLYEKHGFHVEGVRSGSMKVNGSLADEYYMARIMD